MHLAFSANARLAARMMIVYAAIASATMLLAPGLAKAMLPVLQLAVDMLQPRISTVLALVYVDGDWMIELRPMTLETIQLAGDKVLAPFVRLRPIRTHVDHTLVPLVLLLTPVCAWPVARRAEWLVRMLWLAPAMTLVVLATTPVFLAGRFDLEIAQYVMRLGGEARRTWQMDAMVFLESGGRWLLPLCLAAMCIARARVAEDRSRPDPQPEILTPPVQNTLTFQPVSVEVVRSSQQ